jgi:hypothetical protein
VDLDSTTSRIAALSQDKWRWMVDGNLDALADLVRHDAVIVHANGAVVSRDEELAVIRDGRLVYRTVDVEHVTVRLIGPAAVLVGRIRLDALVGGTVAADTFVCTEVFVRDDGRGGDPMADSRWSLAALTFTRPVGPMTNDEGHTPNGE